MELSDVTMTATIAILYTTISLIMFTKLLRIDKVENRCNNLTPLVETGVNKDGKQVYDINPEFEWCNSQKQGTLSLLHKRKFLTLINSGLIGIICGSILKKKSIKKFNSTTNGLIIGGFLVIGYTIISSKDEIVDIYRIIVLLFALICSILSSYYISN